MKLNSNVTLGRTVFCAQFPGVLLLALTALWSSAAARAQSDDAKPNPPRHNIEAQTYQTFHLTSILQQNDLIDIQVDLRNMIPGMKIFSLPSQNAISIRATPEDMELAQKIIADLDHVRKTYRITYTITDIDAGKRSGAQSFSLIATTGEKALLKQGSRVPVVTGSYDASTSTANTEVQYQDIGLGIEATAYDSASGLTLRTKIEQTAVADEKSTTSPQDPIFRQTVLEDSSVLATGKPLVLGSLDIPGSTRRQEVSVVAELSK
jgi:type II secretory pathway component GspD/PulD (secretin)